MALSKLEYTQSIQCLEVGRLCACLLAQLNNSGLGKHMFEQGHAVGALITVHAKE
ncbi:MAG: hypothetical protein SPD80_01220 [Atopobium sp.]|uniref:hypothetical protein n=1 Tax=Atopobium sp. TaxID=1872650 RepID=UPI002A8292DC|nr:hypothetical protein [Atopobium sp.]MDY4522200.1 hypothetical protein [Atopobium sp.]